MLTSLWGWLKGLFSHKPDNREVLVKDALEAAGLRGQNWRGKKATEAFLEEYVVPTTLHGEALKADIIQAAQKWREVEGKFYY